jgi:propanol-preferring alcohol dehydrogenase
VLDPHDQKVPAPAAKRKNDIMKKWALTGARQPLQAMEVITPKPTGTEVLIEISHCGVCHTDLHFWEGEFNLGHGKKVTLEDRGTKFPLTLGHEIVGRVAAVGPDATGVTIGERRAVYPWIGCGKCVRCRGGDENLCDNPSSLGLFADGGFATHVIVPHSRYLFDIGDLDPALVSTFSCSGITVLGAIKKFGRMDPDSPVLIIGAGGLGHAAIATLKALGHKAIIVADIDETKRASALRAGATSVIDGRAEDVTEKIIKAAGGAVLYAIDFVNITRTATSAYNALGKGGLLVLIGVAGGELDLSLAGMVFTVRGVISSNAGNFEDLREIIELAKAGKLQPIPIERMPIADANDALRKLAAGKVTGRLVLENSLEG